MWMVERKNRRLHCGLLACIGPASLHVVGDDTSSMLQLCSFLILTKHIGFYYIVLLKAITLKQFVLHIVC